MSDEQRRRESASKANVAHVDMSNMRVGYRSKQLLTLMGKVEFKRAYYHCQRGREEKEEEQHQLCGQGRS
jgi:hypothetical protein